MVTPAGYSASKGGLLALTRHLATILAPKVSCQRESRRAGCGVSSRYRFEQSMKRGPPWDGWLWKRTSRVRSPTWQATFLPTLQGRNIVVDGGWDGVVAQGFS